MAKYNHTKFFWLMQKEDYFQDDIIVWLESLENGYCYINFYQKLCLKALKTNGVLTRKLGNVFIPYDIKSLADITNIDFDTVTVAMEIFKGVGLIEILDSGEMFLPQLQHMIGSKSIGAFKKQQQIELRSGTKVENLPPNIKINQKLYPNLYSDLNQNQKLNPYPKQNEKINILSSNTTNNYIYSYFEENFGYTISSIEKDKLDDWLNIFDEDIIKYAIETAVLSNVRSFKYLEGILRKWKNSNLLSLTQIKEAEDRYYNRGYSSNMTPEHEALLKEMSGYNWLDDTWDDETTENKTKE